MPSNFDLVCLSHLRWDFVYQRPQHLLSRAAREGTVLFVEEPIYEDGTPRVEVLERDNVRVVVPHLPDGLDPDESAQLHAEAVEVILAELGVNSYVLWYYTPMALRFTRHLKPRAVVYDCMDELSAFHGAHPRLRAAERELFQRADLVFCGGQSLYESKRSQHHDVHLFPSSVDVAHFVRARNLIAEPADQAEIARPKLGFFGVIDERIDLDLVDAVANARPDWQLVLIGPTAKIDPLSLPRETNIHYLGMKSYADLPAYLSAWDVALLPFARNDATRFISPTKTPEYLAAGRPVVSTAITDVVRAYGNLGIVRVAENPDEFIAAVEAALREDNTARQARADVFLEGLSWDKTWAQMRALIEDKVSRTDRVPPWQRVSSHDHDAGLAAEDQAA